MGPTYIHTYIHTYIRTHIHTYIQEKDGDMYASPVVDFT